MAKKAEEKKTITTEKVKKEKPEKEKVKKASTAKGTAARTKKTKSEPKALPPPEIVQNIPAPTPVLSIRERLIKRVNLPQQNAEPNAPKESPKGHKGKDSKSEQSLPPEKQGKPNSKNKKPEDKAQIAAKPSSKQANNSKRQKTQTKPVIDNTIMTRGLTEKEISAMAVKTKAPVLKLKEAGQTVPSGRSGRQEKKGKNKGNINKSVSDIDPANKIVKSAEGRRPSEPPDNTLPDKSPERKWNKRRDKWKKKIQPTSDEEHPSSTMESTEESKPAIVEESRPLILKKLPKPKPKKEQPAKPEIIQDEPIQAGKQSKRPNKQNKLAKKKTIAGDVIVDLQDGADQKEKGSEENQPDTRNKLTKRSPALKPDLSEIIPDEQKQAGNQDGPIDKRNKSNKKKPLPKLPKSTEMPDDEKKQDGSDSQKKISQKGQKAKPVRLPVEKPKKKEVKKPRKKYKPLLSKAEKQDVFIINFLARLEKKLLKDLYLDKESTVLLAVSGGVDSIVLLDAMRILAEKYDFYIVVAHYNHNLRGKSADSDEAFTGGIARKYDLEFSSAKGNVKKYAMKKSISLEHAARVLRYQFLERTARNFHCEYIATAHTSDDSAETFLLNLIRGSGLTGLSGIQSKRPLGKNVILVRPLIDFRKDELIAYAQRRKLEWHEDESNYMLNYTRNRIRHELLPMLRQFNPSISDVINRSAELFQGADEFISNHIKIAIENVVFDKKPDRISLKISLLETFNVFLQGELIKLALDKHFQVPGASLSMVDRIINLMNSETGTIFEINNELIAFKDRDTIIISRKSIFTEINASVIRTGIFKFGDYTLKLEEVPKSNVNISDDKNIEYFDLELVPAILSVRNWKDGDAFIPLGMIGTMKVSDFLTNVKVSLVDKPDVLVLSSKSEILWVIGQRINDRFKVTDSTQKFLRAEIITKRKKDVPA
jgi:tRNA(Ile)-lysidine synthase